MENSLAYELLKEIKTSNKRLFIITIIETVIIISMFVGFLIYESQFETIATVEQTQEVDESEKVIQNMNKGE